MINTNTTFEEGIHAYVSIGNLDYLVSQDENHSNSIIHILHLINFLYIGVEDFISNHTKNGNVKIFIEKVTGSRLHIFFLESKDMISTFKEFCGYCYKLFDAVNQNPKYKTLNNASLNIGAEYGNALFYVFNEDNLGEPTSIGFTPNIAAKIQSCLTNKYLGIGPNLYDKIKEDPIFIGQFTEIDKSLLHKYKLLIQKVHLSVISDLVYNSNMEMLINNVESKISSSKLGDIKIINPRDKENLEIRGLNSVGNFEAIVISADIRGSTVYLENQKHSDEAISKVIQALSTMYNTCKELYGVHVQFQGDKELLYFKIDDEVNAVKYALNLSERIQYSGFHVGIGIASGEIYTTKFGKERSSIYNKKEVGIIGQPVKDANGLEDEHANEDEIYISENVYNKLPYELKTIFKKVGQYYMTKDNIDSYRRKIDCSNNFNERTDINKPWRK